MPSYLVLSAFCLEVYFKCLNVLAKGIPGVGGHDLARLFTELDPAHKTKLEAIYKTLRGNPADIGDVLKEAGKTFELIRYVYEGDFDTLAVAGGWSYRINPVRVAARMLILELRPHLQSELGRVSLDSPPTFPAPRTQTPPV